MIVFGKRTCARSTHTGAPPSYIDRILRPRTLGAYVFAASMVVFLANMIFAFVRKAPAGANPWGQGATTLGWTLPSPPPFHQFDTLPQVVGPSLDGSSLESPSVESPSLEPPATPGYHRHRR